MTFEAKPPKPIEEIIFECARKHWSDREIGAHVGVNHWELARRYGPILEKGRESGKALIKDMQWRAASKGTWEAIKWLSTQYLKQHEKMDHSVEFKNPFVEMSTLEMLEKARELVKFLEAKYEQEMGEPIQPPKKSQILIESDSK